MAPAKEQKRMHPAFYSWWKHARAHRHGWSAEAQCAPPWAEAHGHGGHGHGHGPGREHGHGPEHGHGHGPGPGAHFGGGWDDGAGQAFGVRRPLRFLAHKLDLDENQVSEIARILGELKTERAQADVDQRRTITAFADAIEASTFDASRAAEGGKIRVDSAERVRAAVVDALSKIHAMLEDEQRKKLAYLIRTGIISI